MEILAFFHKRGAGSIPLRAINHFYIPQKTGSRSGPGKAPLTVTVPCPPTSAPGCHQPCPHSVSPLSGPAKSLGLLSHSFAFASSVHLPVQELLPHGGGRGSSFLALLGVGSSGAGFTCGSCWIAAVLQMHVRAYPAAACPLAPGLRQLTTSIVTKRYF